MTESKPYRQPVNQTKPMKYTVKTRSGFRFFTNKALAIKAAKIEKSDGWDTFVKAGDVLISA